MPIKTSVWVMVSPAFFFERWKRRAKSRQSKARLAQKYKTKSRQRRDETQKQATRRAGPSKEVRGVGEGGESGVGGEEGVCEVQRTGPIPNDRRGECGIRSCG